MDVIFLTFIKIEKIVVKHCPDDNCNQPVLIGPVGRIISYGLVTLERRICEDITKSILTYIGP